MLTFTTLPDFPRTNAQQSTSPLYNHALLYLQMLVEMATTIAPMQQLPQELQIGICQHLDKQDLKSARLLCKAITGSAEVILFAQIYIPTTDKGHDKLMAIGQHKRLRQHVKRIDYIFDIFDCWGNAPVQKLTRSVFDRMPSSEWSLLPHTHVRANSNFNTGHEVFRGC